MNRRNFIIGSCGLVASAALPTVVSGCVSTGRVDASAEKPDAIASRGKFERFNASYAHIHIGIEKPFSLLHVSDTHLTAAYPEESENKRKLSDWRTNGCFGGRQEESLRDTLAWAKANCDFVLHTGDLIDFQSRANYDLVKKYFGDGFMTGCMGNHEFSPEMWLSDPKESRDEVFKDRTRKELAKVYPFDLSFHSKIVNGVNFVMLDDVYGYVTAAQVAKFKAEVAKGLPIILCMHVPFFTDGIVRCSAKFWSAPRKYDAAARLGWYETDADCRIQREDTVTRDFIAYLKSEKLLRGILSGHLHLAYEERFSPTAVQYVAPGNYLFAAREVMVD